MPDATFDIHPRESFLLGLCLGEYEASLEVENTTEFMTILKRRMYPYFLWAGVGRTHASITPDELPEDIEWICPSSGEHGLWLGRAPSQPRTLFEAFADDPHFPEPSALLTRIAYSSPDPDQKGLGDLLMASLRPYMRVSLDDYGLLGEPERMPEFFQELTTLILARGSESDDETHVGKEYPKAIHTTLKDHVTSRGDGDLFSIGQEFGRLVYEIEAFSRRVWTDSNLGLEETYKSLRPKIEKSIGELRRHPIVKCNEYADAAWFEILSSTGNVGGVYDKPLSAGAHRLLMNVWLAVGEILGVYRDADAESQYKDATSVRPRASIEPNDSSDAIDTRVRLAELDLNYDEKGRAESVIAATHAAIDVLTKRIWQVEFTKGQKVDVLSVLREKTYKPESELHRRFANVALALYVTYRNQGAHEVGFPCSYEEARAFLAGIRALVALTTQITA